MGSCSARESEVPMLQKSRIVFYSAKITVGGKKMRKPFPIPINIKTLKVRMIVRTTRQRIPLQRPAS